MRSGLPLTLGAVGALAVAAALSRSGSRAFGRDGHWGRAGAGVLLTTGQRVLVLLRSEEVTEPGTWNLAGGAVDPGEDPLTAGLRELEEETGLEIDPDDARVQGSTVWQSPTSNFRYTTSVVRVPAAMERRFINLNWENDDAQWWTAEDLVNHLDDLHPGLRAALPKLLDSAFDDVLPAVMGEIDVPRRPADAPRAPDSPAFRRWFKDSAVVWADGSPRAVYHSGHNTDFEVFDRTRQAGRRAWVKIDTLGSWFASSDQPLYGRSVRGYWLSLQNPKVFAGPGAWRRMYREAEAMARKPGSAWATVYEEQQKKGGFPPYDREALKRGIEQIRVLPKAAVTRLAKAYGVDLGHRDLPDALWSAIATNAVEDYRAALRRQGHDGIFITGDDFDSNQADAWIALEPTQIKALDNAGTFDPEDPRVSANRRESRATVRPPAAFRDLAAWTAWARTEGVELRLAKTPSYTVEITDLFADTTGTGAGTRVMEALVKAADKAGMPLVLHPSSRRNVTFYERFGFVVTGRDGRMRREPKARGSRATDPTSSPAFQRWFGESAVVDKAGRPLIVYHGSPDVRELVQQGFRKSALRGHSYFATDRYDMANSYADPHRAMGDYQQVEEGVVPLYLSIQNPMVLDGHGKPWRGTEPAVEQARAAGHDGLIIHHSEDWYHGPPKRKTKPTRANPYPNAGTVYIWFSPTQAKSAATAPLLSRTDRAPIAGSGPNAGTWNPNDARLSYNRSAR